MLGLFRFNVYLRRMGTLSGIFVAEQAAVKQLTGKHVDFGEALGRHSQADFDLEPDDIKLVTADEEFIKRFNELKLETGYNPFSYLPEDDDLYCHGSDYEDGDDSEELE